MKQKTISQELLEKFCLENSLRLKPVPRSSKSGRKTPDYILTLQRRKVLVEVKQLDPNPQDRARLQRLRNHGSTGVISNEPGHRIRGKIEDARLQIKQRSICWKPAVLVLYDNTGLLIGQLDPHDVLNAMYGEEMVNFFVDETNGTQRIYWWHRFGGKRKVSPRYNTTLSAIAILIEVHKGLEIDFYHNDYAAKRFNPDWLRLSPVRHFRLGGVASRGGLREWNEI